MSAKSVLDVFLPPLIGGEYRERASGERGGEARGALKEEEAFGV